MPFIFANNASTTLDGAVLAADTSIDVINGAALPSPASGFTLRATIQRLSDDAVEIIDITDITSNTLTIVRARESTTALDFASGDVIEMRFTKAIADAFGQLDKDNQWLKGQAGPPLDVFSTANSVPSDHSLRNNMYHLMTENTTLAAPTNIQPGQSGSYEFEQDGTTAFSLAVNVAFVFPNNDFTGMGTGLGDRFKLVYDTAKNGTELICSWVGPIP